ncbi:MAG: iron-regulated protein [Myxococcales bacterium]|nr:iron-regulated protein [Myxococcales bacterium]MCB9708441.1 iron-regulated protein [Myxococcales bacterium]
MNVIWKTWGVLGIIGLGSVACGDDQPMGAVPDALTREAVVSYANIVHASYADSLSTAEALKTANAALVAQPSEEALTEARDAWLAAREPYLETEVYRFYDGPIDNAEDGPEALMNAWPLDENYIDYVEGDAEAGIINDAEVAIDASTLESLNEQGGERNIATGYHAVEFLLWGQDLSADGPGARPYTDYVVGAGSTASNQERRGEYLSTVSDLLVENLAGLMAAWALDDETNYRAGFINLAPKEGLRRILTGMIILSGFETGGERLQAAVDSGEQEEEHSCFSDNTHRDMIQDIEGVQNVYLGTYDALSGTDISGTGIRDVVADRDEALAQAIADKITESLAKANALQVPFDQEIQSDNTEGRNRVIALVTSLHELERLLQDAFRLFELDVPDDPA